MRKWNINPNVGVGPVLFGMTSEQVKLELGPFQLRRTMSGGSIRESRRDPIDEYNHCYFVNDQLFEITFPPITKGVSVNEFLLFEVSPFEALKKLEQVDGTAYERDGFVIFPNISISTSGFADNDLSQKSLTISKKDSWLAEVKNMKKVSFLL